MLDFFRQNPFVVGAFTGSLAAYLLGLLIGHLRREKKWLGYSREMRNIVRRGHSHLSIRYDDSIIDRLDSHRVVIRNIGNRPLSNLPVRFDCAAKSKILEWEVNTPDGAEFANRLDNHDTSLSVSVDLLNPGEAFTVGLTVADSEGEELKVVARAENLILKEIREEGTLSGILDVLAETSTFVKVINGMTKLVLKTF